MGRMSVRYWIGVGTNLCLEVLFVRSLSFSLREHTEVSDFCRSYYVVGCTVETPLMSWIRVFKFYRLRQFPHSAKIYDCSDYYR